MVYCEKKPSPRRIKTGLKTITMRIVYEVIERSTDKDGQFLMIPDIECNTIWTNLG